MEWTLDTQYQLAPLAKEGRFCAASVSSMLNDERSSEMLRIQVERGRPGGLLQFSGVVKK